MVNQRRSDAERGFTLVELMIVVAIIAILAGILIPNFVNARAQAQAAACQSNMRAIATAEELYYTDQQNYIAGDAKPGTLTPTAGGSPYLSNQPHDPSAVDPNAPYVITLQTNTDSTKGYYIKCPGLHPANTVAKLASAAQQAQPAVNAQHQIYYTSGAGFSVDQQLAP